MPCRMLISPYVFRGSPMPTTYVCTCVPAVPKETSLLTIQDRKSTRLNSSHVSISYAVFCLNDMATTCFSTLSLPDALPILLDVHFQGAVVVRDRVDTAAVRGDALQDAHLAVRIPRVADADHVRLHVRARGAEGDVVVDHP